MNERAFGNTGVSVSMLGFGAARLPETKPWRFDLDKSVPVLRRAFDLGVSYIDSAHVYGAGTSETAIGRAIQGYDRSKLYLTTKIPSSSENETRPSVWSRRLHLSLRRLDTPYVDFLFLHGLEWKAFVERTSRPRRALEMARKAQAEGLFRHLCFSSHDTPENIMRLIDTGEFVGMLVQYNALDRRNEAAIAHAARKGMGVSVMGPLAAGLLAGSAAGWPGAPDVIAAEMALRYAWRNPNISVPISGMSSVEQVEHNAAAAGRCANQGEAERDLWERFFEQQERLADAYCTYCGACLPCPKRVNIAENFRYMNWQRAWGMEKEARAAYAKLGGKTRWEPWGKINGRKASACSECGECEPRCPLGIPIMAQLRDTAAVLGK